MVGECGPVDFTWKANFPQQFGLICEKAPALAVDSVIAGQHSGRVAQYDEIIAAPISEKGDIGAPAIVEQPPPLRPQNLLARFIVDLDDRAVIDPREQLSDHHPIGTERKGYICWFMDSGKAWAIRHCG